MLLHVASIYSSRGMPTHLPSPYMCALLPLYFRTCNYTASAGIYHHVVYLFIYRYCLCCPFILPLLTSINIYLLTIIHIQYLLYNILTITNIQYLPYNILTNISI